MHYYNEIDPFCCEVLRARVADGRLSVGKVDQRSITHVGADDVVGFAVCHWFAGVGGFALAARLAGWPDDWELWTGGFPCQDVSAAGPGGGLGDAQRPTARSGLWWAWFKLIKACRPARLLVENVAALRGRGADDVLSALEGIGYACWPVVVGADDAGAPHRRERVWIVCELADAVGGRGGRRLPQPLGPAQIRAAANGAGDGELADAAGVGCGARRGLGSQPDRTRSGRAELAGDHQLAHARGAGREERHAAAIAAGARQHPRRDDAARWPARPGELQRGWEQPRLLEWPRDAAQPQRALGRAANGVPRRLVRCVAGITGRSDARALAWCLRNRVRMERWQNRSALKAMGNAIVPQVAELILRAWMGASEMNDGSPQKTPARAGVERKEAGR